MTKCLQIFVGQAAAASAMTQSKMSSFLTRKSVPMSRERYTRVARKLVQMCAIDLRPLSMVEGAGFRYDLVFPYEIFMLFNVYYHILHLYKLGQSCRPFLNV